MGWGASHSIHLTLRQGQTRGGREALLAWSYLPLLGVSIITNPHSQTTAFLPFYPFSPGFARSFGEEVTGVQLLSPVSLVTMQPLKIPGVR
jgi:hypothetical protein